MMYFETESHFMLGVYIVFYNDLYFNTIPVINLSVQPFHCYLFSSDLLQQ